ncbi:MAG: HAMP domain-containing histidine kinase [Prevotellaceae bacterium]|jgi:two-component system phosphate regulon sensor histidine kinase PhoR|nr:HAMP domain-containing histidine kinase [Prevotellaceae bacterium]
MMQRKILIITMLLAAIGIVLIQVIWIMGVYRFKNNEIKVKAEEALANVVTRVWQEESYNSMGYTDKQLDSIINFDKVIRDNANRIANIGQDSWTTKRYFVETLVERMNMVDIPIEQRVTVAQIDSLLKRELNRLDVKSKFQISVCDANNKIIIASDDYIDEEDHTRYKKVLFPQDPWFAEQYFVVMYLENEYKMIISYIWTLILSSIILTIIVFAIFIHATYIISTQKKISSIKNDFISNITHELKTPISTISLAAQMLGDENIPQTAKNIPKLSSMIKEQSRQLSFLVEKVLQSSVFERQTLTLNSQEVSLHSLIKEADDIMTLQLRNRKATLITELRATSDIILTDKAYFVNVITNLLDNALKYSKEVPKIVIGTKNEDRKIICYVADNGIGIKNDDLGKVFDQFFRVHTGDVHNVKGFGLGLNYVKKIVELSGGTVNIESEVNRGTTFYLSLPLYNKENKS